MSHSPDNGSAADDKVTDELLARLYSDVELDEGVESEISEEELASFRSVQNLFRELPVEDSSDAVNNRLLALAAQHAPAAADSSEGIFAKLRGFFSPVFLHPAAAAMATFVLFAGVAGTLYLRGGAQIAEPTVSSESQPPEPGARALAPEPDFPAEAKEEAVGAEQESADDADEVLSAEPYPGAEEAPQGSGANIGIGGELDNNRSGLRAVSDESKSRAPAPSKRKRGAVEKSAGGGSTDRTVKDIVTKELAPVSRPDLDERSKSPAAAKNAPAKPKPSSAPPPAPPATTNSGTSTGTTAQRSQDQVKITADTPKDSTSEDEEESGESQAARLHQLAKVAAKKQDCAAVLRYGTQIRKLSSAYYDRTFLADQLLEPCRRSATTQKK